MLLMNWLTALSHRCRRTRFNLKSSQHPRGAALSGWNSRRGLPRTMAQAIELLETRQLLAAAGLSGGTLNINDASGINDQLSITISGSLVTIVDPTNTMTAGSGATQVDTHTVTVPRGSITGGVVINANGGNDRVTLGGQSSGLGVSVNGGGGLDEFVIRNGTIANVTFDGGAGTDSVVNRSGLASAPTLASVETNVDRPLLMIPGFGGTQSADMTPAGVQEWLLNRGRTPDQLALEPLANAYSDIAQTFDNIGYTPSSTYFTVKWDWRMPVAASNDSTNDGLLSDVTLTKLQTQQTSPTWDSGVSYLAWYLGQASTAWQTLTGSLPAEVDLVTHSTGGLVARSYLQSAAYQANDPSLDTLPEIHTLIQVGVPSQGSGQTFDLLNNDFGLKPAARILGRAVDQAYQLVLDGQTIQASDGTSINLASLAGQADPQKAFIRRYISTLQDLLSTRAFLDDNQNGVADPRLLLANQGGNSLLFDMNANNGLTNFGAIVDDAFIIFSNEASTAELATTHTGPVLSKGAQNEQVSLSELFGHLPKSNEVWTSFSNVNGDGTVAFESAAAPYIDKPNFQLINITQAAAGAAAPIEHTGLVYNTFAQKQIVQALTGRSVASIPNTDISTNLLRTLPQTVTLLVSSGLVNPLDYAASGMQKLQGFVDDIQGEMNAALAKDIPLLRLSVNDMLGDPLKGLNFDVFSKFATVFSNLADAPDLETLEHRVEQEAGFSDAQFEITFVNGVLDLAFDFNVTNSTTFDINFGQSSDLGITGSIPLTAALKLDADFHLTLDVGGYLASGHEGSGTDFLSVTLNQFDLGATLSANNINVGLNLGALGSVTVQNGTASIGAVLGIDFKDADNKLSVAELLSAGTFASVVDFIPQVPVNIHLPVFVNSGSIPIKVIDFQTDDALFGNEPRPAMIVDGDYIVVGNKTLDFNGDVLFSLASRILGNSDGTNDALTINAKGAVSFRGLVGVGGSGLRDLTVNSDVDVLVGANNTIQLPGGNVEFFVSSAANGKVELEAGAKVITRQFSGVDPVAGASTGDSGRIIFSANEVKLASGSKLLAQVQTGSAFQPGDIQLLAADDEGRTFLGPLSFSTQIAKITLTNATVLGGNITFASAASDINESNDKSRFISGFLGDLVDLVDQVPGMDSGSSFDGIDASIMFRGAESTIELNNSTITASGSVWITSTADARTDIEAAVTSTEEIKYGVAVGYGKASAQATTSILGTTTIVAGLDVLVTSDANALSAVKSAVKFEETEETKNVNSKNFSISVAIAQTSLTSTLTTTQNTVITSQNGNVNLRAFGNVTNTPDAQSDTSVDGLGGIVIALGFDNSNVTSTADGTITAKGRDAAIPLNPQAAGAVNETTNTITLPNHGLSLGDEVIYQNGGGGSIGGLTNGEKLTAIVLDANTIQLARGPSLDLENGGVDSTASHTLTGYDTKDFRPGVSGVVSADQDTITIPNHGFQNDDEIIYSSGDKDAIPGLASGTMYKVAFRTATTFRLRDVDSGALIDLNTPSSGVTEEHSFLFEKPSKAFTPATAVNNDLETIQITGHGFQTGDAVRYRIDPTKSRTVDGAIFSDAEIRGLDSGEVFYVVVVDANTIRLSDSIAGAKAAAVIDLTSKGTGTAHSFDIGLVEGIGVIAHLDATNQATTGNSAGAAGDSKDEPDQKSADVKSSDSASKAKNLVGNDNDVSSFSKGNDTAEKSKGTKFSGAGSIVVNYFNHDALAMAGSNSQLKSERDLKIDSSIEERARMQGQSSLTKSESEGTSVGVAASIAVGIYENTSQAIVASGAHLDAKNDIVVNSEVSYPYLVDVPDLLNPVDYFSQGLDGLDAYLEDQLGFTSGIMNTWVFTTASNKGDGGISIAGAVAVTDFTNVSEAIVRSGAFINQSNDVKYRNANQQVDVTAATTMQLVQMTGIGSIDLSPDNVKAAVKSRDLFAAVNPIGNEAGKGGVGGAFLLTFVDNTTTAKIEQAARVTTGLNGGLNVTANEEVTTFAFVQAGGEAGTFGISGSVGVLVHDSVTHAFIEDGAIIVGGPVNVSADSSVVHINLAGAVQKGESIGVGVSVGINLVDRNTAAYIGNATGLAAGSGTTMEVSSLTVSAKNEGNLYAFSLAAAIISKDPPAPDEEDTATKTSSAESSASSKKSSSTEGKQGKFGLGISGAVSFNSVTDTVQAYINDSSTMHAGAIAISADNETRMVAAAGAAAFVKAPPDKTSVGLAGSYAHTQLTGTTKAFVVGARLEGTSLTVTANREGDIISVAAGGAGAPTKKGIAIAGSVTVNNITDTTEAIISGATIVLTGSLMLDSHNSADIISVAGALAFGGKAGIGAGVSVNTINATTNAKLINSTLTYPGSLSVSAVADGEITSVAGSIGASSGDIGAAGTVAVNFVTNNTEASIRGTNKAVGTATPTGATSVRARSQNYILTISGAVGASKNVGLGAALTYTSIDGTTTAFVDSSQLATSGSLSVTANAEPLIDAIAVGVGVGKTAGLAGSVTINFLDANVDAHISGGSNLSASQVTVSASDGAGSAFNPGSAVTGNSVEFGATHGFTTGDAFVYSSRNGKPIGGLEDGTTYYAIVETPTRIRFASSKSNAMAGTGITLDKSAAEGTQHFIGRSGIRSLAGAIAGGSKAAVGAAAGYNDVSNSFSAVIDGSTVTATTGPVALSSNTNAVIKSLTVGGSGAGTFALGGSVSINSISNTLDTHVSNGANVTGAGIGISSADNSTIQTIAGGLGFGGTAGVGAAVAINEISNTVLAHSTSSTLNAGANSITIDAATNADMLSITIGGGAGGTFALGGSVSLNQLSNTTTARATGGTLTAGDSVRIAAYDDVSILNIGGGLAGGGTAGIGIGAATVVSSDVTEAFVGANTTINAKGNGVGLIVHDGQLDSNDNPTTTTVRGLSVVAVTTEDILSVAAGGAGGGTVGVGGSVSLNLLTQTTRAHIDAGALINNSNSGASANQEVRVSAADLTKILGIGGALGGGGTVGIGAGVDLAIIC